MAEAALPDVATVKRSDWIRWITIMNEKSESFGGIILRNAFLDGSWSYLALGG